MKAPFLLILLIALPSVLHAQTDTCIDFENLSVGTGIPNGTSFAEDGVLMTIGTYIDANDNVGTGPGTIIGSSPHEGNALSLSNSTLKLEFDCVQALTLVFGNNGGNINIVINGQREFIKTLDPPYSIGGVDVAINHNGSTGTMTFQSDTANISSLCVGGQEFVVDHICFLPCDSPDCFDFEGLSGSPLNPGETFTEDGINVTVIPFDGANGTVTGSDTNNAGHFGNELVLTKAGIGFTMDCASEIAFAYQQDEDGISIVINGERWDVDDMVELDGKTVGGATISISNGQVTITGVIEDFQIAGNSLAIDHLCRGECPVNCIDFESETVGTIYADETSFVEDGIKMTVHELENNGQVEIEGNQRAGHVGNDAAMRDAVLRFGIPCATEITLHFGQYEKGIFLSHGGDTTTPDQLASLDGTNFNGTMITGEGLQINDSFVGTLTLTGQIEDFAIGGVNLVIDHVCHIPCPDPDCVDFEVFPFGKVYSIGETITEDLTPISITRYGTGSSGSLEITGGNLAGHVGNEARLRNALASFEFLCASEVEIHFFRPASGVRLGVNGSFANSTGFSTFNGQTIGGANVTVANGKITITGDEITNVTIGGADTVIDHICHVDCVDPPNCITFESLPLGDPYLVDDFASFTEDNFLFQTYFYELPNGDFIDDGTVTVST